MQKRTSWILLTAFLLFSYISIKIDSYQDSNYAEAVKGSPEIDIKNLLIGDGQISIKVPKGWKKLKSDDSIEERRGRLSDIEMTYNKSDAGIISIYSSKLPFVPFEEMPSNELKEIFKSSDIKKIKENYGYSRFVYRIPKEISPNSESHISKGFVLSEDIKQIEVSKSIGNASGISFVGHMKESSKFVYSSILQFFIYDRIYIIKGSIDDIDKREKLDKSIEELFSSIRFRQQDKKNQ